jgi:BirA family biotin operon repressor/biotin-[acetyl-CoA-carboxylase] ligase
VKWPNDVLVGGRKVSGILLENLGDSLVCGIGINVAHHPETDRRPATDLGLSDVEPVFQSLITHMRRRETQLRDTGFDSVRATWIERAYGIDTDIRVTSGGRNFAGRFSGLGPNGELMLRTSTGTVPIVAGDVTYTEG